MKSAYKRKLSYNERLYVAGDRVSAPVVNQFVFDGSGVLDPALWRDAVRKASEANPGARVVLKGFLGWSRWRDSGISPPVVELDGAQWKWNSPEGIPPHLKTTFDVRKGPTCEVTLVHGEPLRVVFRTHHGVMDGMGTFIWAEDICRALRGEPLLGSDSAVTDLEICRSQQKEYRTPFPFDNLSASGKADGTETGVTYFRMSREGKFHNLLGQAAILAAREAWKHGPGKVRFSVPVDMRRHLQGVRSTANLTMPIYIEVTEASTPEEIAQSVKEQLEKKRECLIDREDPLLNYVPMAAIARRWKKLVRVYHEKGLYRTSGVISNVGKIPPMPLFSGGGFQARHFWAIPPAYDNIPLFIGLASSGNMLEVITSMPKVLATKGRIEQTTENILAGLIPVSPSRVERPGVA